MVTNSYPTVLYIKDMEKITPSAADHMANERTFLVPDQSHSWEDYDQHRRILPDVSNLWVAQQPRRGCMFVAPGFNPALKRDTIIARHPKVNFL